MSTPESDHFFPSKNDELQALMEEALGRPVSPTDTTETTEWKVAQAIVQSRLQSAAEVLGRIQAGENIPDAQIDYPALAIVHNVISQLQEGRS